MPFTTYLKAYLFVPGVDDEVGAAEAKYSATQLSAKTSTFTIAVNHALSTPTNTEIKTAFEDFFGATDLVYRSFINGFYNGVIRAGNPSTLANAADATFFNMSMHSDGTTVTYSVPVARFLSYGNSPIETNLIWSIYPEDSANYALMLKKGPGDNEKNIVYSGSVVRSSAAKSTQGGKTMTAAGLVTIS